MEYKAAHLPDVHDAGSNRGTHGHPLMYGASTSPSSFALEPGSLFTDLFSIGSAVANNFWGKEDAGVQPMLERMHAAKQTCDELRSFYNSKAHQMPIREIGRMSRR